MRVTLTLDDDVASLLKRVRDKRKAQLRQIVNEALREGLTRMSAPSKSSRPYRTPAVSLGRCLVGSLDNAAKALAAGEGGFSLNPLKTRCKKGSRQKVM